MILQNILFPSISTCTEEHMYFHRNEKTFYSTVNNYVEMKKGGYLGFDSYFNLFNLEKWFKYTNVKSVNLVINVKGTVKINFFRKEWIQSKVITEQIGDIVHESEEFEEITIPFNSSSLNGTYGFSLFALKSNTVFYGGYFASDIPEENVNKVKIAIDICTYRREKFVEANLNLLNKRFLRNESSPLYGKLEVFVSDNAKTLEADKLRSPDIHIFENKNAGGAGGFTRGLIEVNKVKKEKGITHVLLMDDDVCIEPESIFRTFTLLSCVKNEYKNAFIGGAMLRLDTRNIQTESGAAWNGGKLISFKQNLDLNNLECVLFNEVEEAVQFNAWWFCAFPAGVITDENLPMPIFIRGDDVEYGLRNMKKLILLNGICVWHEPFEYKYSSSLFYYILRNRLIDNSLHDMIMSKSEVKETLRQSVTEQLWLYRYKNADLIMDGLEDFLKGVDWLSQQDGEKINGSIMAKGYKLQPVDNIEDASGLLYGEYEASTRQPLKTDFKSKVIRRLTINGHSLKSTKDYGIVPTVNVSAESVFRTETVLNYDFCSRKGFVTKKDKLKAKQCMKRYKKVCGLIDKRYDAAVNDYKNNFRKLTSIDFWSRYLELEK